MIQQITVLVLSVDGVSYHEATFTSAEKAEEWLSEHDHEGAFISVTISAQDEQAYQLLRDFQ